MLSKISTTPSDFEIYRPFDNQPITPVVPLNIRKPIRDSYKYLHKEQRTEDMEEKIEQGWTAGEQPNPSRIPQMVEPKATKADLVANTLNNVVVATAAAEPKTELSNPFDDIVKLMDEMGMESLERMNETIEPQIPRALTSTTPLPLQCPIHLNEYLNKPLPPQPLPAVVLFNRDLAHKHARHDSFDMTPLSCNNSRRHTKLVYQSSMQDDDKKSRGFKDLARSVSRKLKDLGAHNGRKLHKGNWE